MDWKQLKQRFPGLSPTADADFDGLVNSKDCRPLDPSKDGAFSRFVGIVTRGKKGQSASEYKAEKESKTLAKQIARREKVKKVIERKTKGEIISESQKEKLVKRREAIEKLKERFKSKTAEKVETIIRRRTPTTRKELEAVKARRKRIIVKQIEKFAGVRGAQAKGVKTAKGVKGAGAGRPKQSYKYRDPRTGQPISAVEYHRLRKQLKSQAKAVETQTEVKQRFALAKRGLSPEEVTAAQESINAKMARLRAIKEAKQQGIVIDETGSPEFEEQVIQEEAQQIPEEVIQQQMSIPEAQVQQQVGQYQPQYSTQAQRTQHIEPMIAIPGARGIPPGYKLQEDLMTGRKALVPLPPKEAWTR